LFALAAGDDDDEEAKIPEEKVISTANSMADNILKGIGVHGVIISAAKNTIMDLIERSQKDPYFNPDAPSFPGPEYTDAISKLIAISPPLSIKLRKIKGGITDWYFNRWRPEAGEIFNINNPSYRAASKVIAGVTNVPLDRLFQKIENIQGAMDDVNPTWQRIFMALGWPKWQLETEKEKEKRKATEKKEKRNIRAEDKPSIYNKAEQVNILKQYGLTETEIKKLKNEDQRVKKIEALRKKTNKIYIPKNVKKEKTKTKEKKAKEKKKSSPFSTRLKNKKLTTTFN
jgi:DNA-directed RNA polymerase subunit H (RpoH/RPB5)